MQRPYLMKKRGKYWYYRLAGETDFHSAGRTARARAEEYVVRLIECGGKENSNKAIRTLAKCAGPFFDWDRRPHVRRLREEGKSITRNYAKIQRLVMKKHIFKDVIVKMGLVDITQADIVAFFWLQLPG